MANSVYHINKGVNRSIEFKGLKAQYIWYLGGGMMVLMILYAIMYIAGLSSWICIVVIALLGTGITVKVYSLSNKYGEHGMMKAMARRSIPKCIKIRTRKAFLKQPK